jgi:YD repeat-containing protein
LYHKTLFARNTFGNVTSVEEQVTDPGQTRRLEIPTYDDRQIFPREVVNSLGHVTTLAHDQARGLLIQEIDPNGDITRHGYDLFGRHKYTRAPEGEVELQYDAPSTFPAGGTEFQRLVVTTIPHGGATSRVFLDGQGRARVSETSGFGGATILTENSYDWAGRLKTAARPHLAGDQTQGVEKFTYDLRGRLVIRVFADGTWVNYFNATRNTLKVTGATFASLTDAFGDWKATELSASTKRVLANTFDFKHEHTSVTDPSANPLTTVDAAGT